MALVEAHLAPIQATFDAANAMLREAGEDRDSRRAHLATWLVSGDDSREDWVTRPLGETGLFEILGFHASGTAVPVSAAAAATLGAPQELFELGEDAIRRALVVEPAGLELLSGEASLVTGLPSPTAAIPHLMTWLPDAVGPYGALVAVGDASRLVVLPIHDASAVLDLPALLGLAVGASMRAAWTIPPTVFWLVPDRLEVIHVVITDGVVTTATTTADLAALVARLPTAPQRLPAGLPAILGPEGSRRFYGLLHAAVVRRLTDDPAGLSELTLFLVRDLAGTVRDLPAADWAKAIDEWIDAVAAPRRELDRLTVATDYAEVVPSLGLRVSRTALAGSELARNIGGGLASYPTIDAGPRHRRVTYAMLERWGVDADRCFADAASNMAGDPALIDEPMYADQPTVRQVYSRTAEREAAGLCLHLRYPGTRHGFVVSITHGSRAHYVRLDDPGAMSTIPVFAKVIEGIYREADEAADARSPWLFWLTPDGKLIELFDVLQPLPQPDGLPTEFRARMDPGMRARLN